MTIYKSTCPLDCPDTCGLLVHVENSRVVKIEGDPKHPLTRGFLCSKGYRHLHRLYNSQRLTQPLLKKEDTWQVIEWSQAYDIIAEKLYKIKTRYGSTAVLLHAGEGSGGKLHNLAHRFCNAYGGVTTPKGSICWGSGYAAQEQDFGLLQLHDWPDVLNSRLIVLWGRDPHTTNLHLVPFIKESIFNQAKLMVINPVRIKAAENADLHISLYPGTDGILALGMANIIIQENLYDQDFVHKFCKNFNLLKKLVRKYSTERVSELTGVPTNIIHQAAIMYATTKPASIFLGYGMQRYANGGNNIRAIDTLAALTGNIGVPGGGTNYAHQLWQGFFNDIKGPELAINGRSLAVPILAQEIINANNPPVEAIVVTRSNPVNQLPNTPKVIEAFQSTDFVVVVDMFMTDTAELADLVLPCTYFLEEENIIASSWNHYLGFAPKVVDPQGKCKPDYEIFTDLARHMNLPGFELRTPRQWVEWFLEPATQNYGITIEKLAQGAMRHPIIPAVPWSDGKFYTPSGKFEFCLKEPDELYEPPDEEYPLQLITAHHRNYMHSQFQNLNLNRSGEPPVVEIHPLEGKKRNLCSSQLAVIRSPRGKLLVKVSINDRVPPKIALIYQGSWVKLGGGVNQLTPDLIADLGTGTPFYDCHCQLEPGD